MGNKNRNLWQMNWLAATPVPFVLNTPPSGVLTGAMASTNTIYTNIIDVSLKDNLALEFTWTGTPTGTITIYASASGANFYALTSPTITQPAGSASGGLYQLNQVPYQYLYVKYVNASGTGVLTAYISTKDLN